MTSLLQQLRSQRSPFPATWLAVEPGAHTMGDNLAHYVLPKCPSELLGASHRLKVKTTRDLAALNGAFKRAGKPFNWRRPWFDFDNGLLTCYVSPGGDYVYHYARLLGTACHILGIEPTMEVALPEPDDTVAFMDQWLPPLEPCDVAVIGYVERLLMEEGGDWHYEFGFGWRYITVNGSRVLMLGCEFSYWGDLAGALVKVLAQRNITRWVVYAGKLGTLNQADVPNRHVATGTTSLVEDDVVTWRSRLNLSGLDPQIVLLGQRHATTPSIIDETRDWYAQLQGSFDLVDPEIGRMAAVAGEVGLDYDYLHVVTDNLSGHHEEGLYFERHPDIVAARLKCIGVISDVLRRSI
ncbi:MAG TPA: hypothetical protein VI322_01580 [Candidatus Saccharimonadia bacterium]